MAVDKPIEFNVVIILTERIDKDFSHFQPSDVEAELKQTNDSTDETNIRNKVRS
jgi:hypothetical protein